MLEEGVPLIKRLLDPGEDRTTFEGRYFRADRAACLPGPVGGRRLPIWIGGVGPKRTPRLAARHADGWNAAYIGPEEYGTLNAAIDQACEAEGRDPATLQRSINLLFMLSTNEAGAAAAERGLTEQWGAMAARVQAGALMGTPEAAVERIAAYAAAGANGLNVALRAPWEPEALDAYLEVVVPAARAALA
jgi:alkanesulfonate monooxygenase SsuD/methylene tetrahydromethanopterin reductase-like flavin-dependent oxidoreductase (luciferase family)